MQIANVPDEQKVNDLLRNVGMSKVGPYIAVQEIRTMAGRNIIANLDAQDAIQDANLESIRSERRTQVSSIR